MCLYLKQNKVIFSLYYCRWKVSVQENVGNFWLEEGIPLFWDQRIICFKAQI